MSGYPQAGGLSCFQCHCSSFPLFNGDRSEATLYLVLAATTHIYYTTQCQVRLTAPHSGHSCANAAPSLRWRWHSGWCRWRTLVCTAAPQTRFPKLQHSAPLCRIRWSVLAKRSTQASVCNTWQSTGDGTHRLFVNSESHFVSILKPEIHPNGKKSTWILISCLTVNTLHVYYKD